MASGMTGGYGRALSRGQKISGPEKPGEKMPPEHAVHEGHSQHATIHKHGPGHFSVEHEHGKSEHGNFKEAAHAAGQAMGESVEEPESGEDAPMENALGMVKDGMGGDD